MICLDLLKESLHLKPSVSPSATTIHILYLTSIEPVLIMRDGGQYILYIQLLNKA
jgi:hypothetical protein